ncbi:hypothetical protein NPX13_g4440 [Xylaria arbuscula]|uniref:Uncharacterized protein n=1 Tax=Xylaria arbuscula TaxID=114810 RepID=A0A9W8TLY2_9PEZI|nr:hypothetical protein NPX13_g4440 [Xylaria arbuscula]
MGPYWEQPGRNILRGLLRSVEVPGDYWKDVTRFTHNPGEPDGEDVAWLKKRMTLGEIEAYSRTYSCYSGWKDAHPEMKSRADGGDGDVVDFMWDQMVESTPEWKAMGEQWREAEIMFDWGTYLIMARRNPTLKAGADWWQVVAMAISFAPPSNKRRQRMNGPGQGDCLLTLACSPLFRLQFIQCFSFLCSPQLDGNKPQSRIYSSHLIPRTNFSCVPDPYATHLPRRHIYNNGESVQSVPVPDSSLGAVSAPALLNSGSRASSSKEDNGIRESGLGESSEQRARQNAPAILSSSVKPKLVQPNNPPTKTQIRAKSVVAIT